MNARFVIQGVGFHVPERIVANQELEGLVDTSDEWIVSRTGIKARHFAAKGESTSDLALRAAQKALADAGLEASDLTHIILATITPDFYCPSAACLLEEKLGVKGLVALDVNAACSGFLYALEMGRGVVALHPEAVVLVIAAEVLSSRTNFNDRSTCVLFGDGSGAMVLTAADRFPDKTPAAGLVDIILASDGALGNLLTIKGGGSARPYVLGEATTEDFYIQMGGREVFRHAVRSMEAVCAQILERHGLGPADVDKFIPHQANLRIMEAVAKKLEIDRERVFVNVDRYGNTSASSIPIAFAEADASGFLVKDDLILLTTFGGGFTWASALLRMERAEG